MKRGITYKEDCNLNSKFKNGYPRRDSLHKCIGNELQVFCIDEAYRNICMGRSQRLDRMEDGTAAWIAYKYRSFSATDVGRWRDILWRRTGYVPTPWIGEQEYDYIITMLTLFNAVHHFPADVTSVWTDSEFSDLSAII